MKPSAGPPSEGFVVVDAQGTVVDRKRELLDALPVLRAQPGKARILREADGEPIAWTTGGQQAAEARKTE